MKPPLYREVGVSLTAKVTFSGLYLSISYVHTDNYFRNLVTLVTWIHHSHLLYCVTSWPNFLRHSIFTMIPVIFNGFKCNFKRDIPATSIFYVAFKALSIFWDKKIIGQFQRVGAACCSLSQDQHLYFKHFQIKLQVFQKTNWKTKNIVLTWF